MPRRTTSSFVEQRGGQSNLGAHSSITPKHDSRNGESMIDAETLSEISILYGDSDSGYVSSSGRSQMLSAGLSRVGLKRRKQDYFEKAPPESALECKRNWVLLFGKPLQECISKEVLPHPPLELSLRYFGETEDSAKLYLVILCHPRLLKSVQKFVKQKHVRNQYSSEFDLQVVCHPPKPAVSLETIQIYKKSVDTARNGSSHAFLISIVQDGCIRYATVGGAIMVSLDRRNDVYGLTAGHIYQTFDLAVPEGDATAEEGDDCCEGDGSEDMQFEIEPHPSFQAFATTSPDFCTPPSTADSRLKLVRAGHNLDWALVELDSEKPLLNSFTDPIFTDGNVLGFNIPNNTPPPSGLLVLALCGRSGVKIGTLASGRSALMLAPGIGFVETYSLKLHEGSGTPSIIQHDSEMRLTKPLP